MKQFYFLFFILMFNSAIAQQYILKNGRKIRLTKDSTVSIISYPKDLSNQALSKNIDSVRRYNQGVNIQNLSPSIIIVTYKTKPIFASNATIKNAYVSSMYKDSLNNPIFVLPQIVMKLTSSSSAKTIMSEFGTSLSLTGKNNGVYKFSCNVTNSDELFKVLDQIYSSNRFKELITWCEPLFYFKVSFFDDPFYDQQYYLKNTGQNGGTAGIDININPTWDFTKGNTNISVAVIGEGVEAHEDLGTNLLSGYTVGGGNGEPQNANSYDSKGHGEACAGIISALHNNLGVKGIAPNCKIVPVNIAPFTPYLDPYGNPIIFASNTEIGDAITWASQNADILSCSWGGGMPSSYVESAIDDARTLGRNGKGCPVIFSSGNAIPYTNVSWPGNYDGVITVGAINKTGIIWNYSNRGASMDLVAPSGNTDLAGDVETLDRMGANGYNSGNYMSNFGGTSAAAPEISGVAALLLSINPELTEAQLKSTMQNTARDLGSTGFDNTYGYGLVNSFEAINSILPAINGPSSLCGSSIYTISNLPTGATVTWSATPSGSVSFSNSQNGQVTVTKQLSGSASINASISINGGTYSVQKTISLPSYGGPGNIKLDVPLESCLTYGSTRWFQALDNNNQSVCNISNITEIEWKVFDYSNNTQITNYSKQSCGTVTNSSIGISLHANPTPYVITIIARAKDQCGNWGKWGPGFSYFIKPSCSSFIFALSPNPATGSVNISSVLKNSSYSNNGNTNNTMSKLTDITKVNIYDQIGTLKKEYNYQSVNQVKLDISTLKAGIYYVEIITKHYKEKQILQVK